jgi:hypothetical protein
MNTLTKPTNISQRGADAPAASVLSVQRACLLLLGSVMLLPSYAQRVPNLPPDINIVGQGTGPGPVFISQTPPMSPMRDPIGGLPGQGGGAYLAPAPAPSPSTPAALPPTVAPPAAPQVTTVPAGPPAGPASVASVNSTLPAPNDPVKPPQGNQPPETPSGGGGGVGQPVGIRVPTIFTNNGNIPPLANGVNGIKPPVKQGSSQGAQNAVGSAGGLGEILPGAEKLGESMQEQAATAKDTGTSAATTVAQTKCTAVSLRPDAQRQAVSLVDMLGNGLIVAAVPDAHIQSVFSRAGYGSVDLSKAARWCITPTAARELLQPARDMGGQDAALLVQTGGGLQLMSQDQWLAHQASLKPLVAMETPVKAVKVTKATKVVGRVLNKPTAKSATGVTVGVLRLPAGTGKAAGAAS